MTINLNNINNQRRNEYKKNYNKRNKNRIKRKLKLFRLQNSKLRLNNKKHNKKNNQIKLKGDFGRKILKNIFKMNKKNKGKLEKHIYIININQNNKYRIRKNLKEEIK